jgi:secreted Zn-dependent insulinase-like peptidase
MYVIYCMCLFTITTADLVWSLDMGTTGLQMTVMGWSHKLPLLLEKLLAHVPHLVTEYAGETLLHTIQQYYHSINLCNTAYT